MSKVGKQFLFGVESDIINNFVLKLKTTEKPQRQMSGCNVNTTSIQALPSPPPITLPHPHLKLVSGYLYIIGEQLEGGIFKSCKKIDMCVPFVQLCKVS